MKTISYVILMLFCGFIYGQSSVIISQYIEGVSGTNFKGIEIANISGADIVFSPTNNLQIHNGVNGMPCTALPGTNITSGTLAAGEVLVIGNTDVFNYANTNGTDINTALSLDFNINHNGDDALALYLGGVIQDMFGTCGNDPGAAWNGNGVSTRNFNLQISSGICDGDIDGWTDPSERFDEIADGDVLIGFGDAPIISCLNLGDVVITGYNASGLNDRNRLSFLLLTDIPRGTVLKFTDEGWNTTNNELNQIGGDGTIIWEATSDLPCGTEVQIQTIDGDPNSALFDMGIVSHGIANESTTGNYILNSGIGDEIIVYQGTQTNPSFLFAIHWGNNDWTNATSRNDSAVPPGLTDGVNALYMGDFGNGKYTCLVEQKRDIFYDVLAQIPCNWQLQTSSFTLGGCSFSCPVTVPTTTVWDGTTWSNGTPTLLTDVLLDGDYNTTSHGNLLANNLYISCINLEIENNTFVEVDNNLRSNGTITVATEGAFKQNNDLGEVLEFPNGSTTVNKTTAPATDWFEYTYWGTPVSGETIENALADTQPNRRFIFNAENYLDATMEVNNNNATNPGQDDIDDDGNDWEPFITGTMLPGVGYATTQQPASFVSGKSYSFQGSFNNGVFNVPVYRNDFVNVDNNWNLIANPYASAVDAQEFLDVNTYNASLNPTGALSGVIYVWSHNTTSSSILNGNQVLNFDTSDYATINGIGGVAAGDMLAPNGFIPSCQGFFIHYDDNSTPTSTSINSDGHTIAQGQIIFNNSMRANGSSDNSTFFKATNSKGKSNINNDNKLWLNFSSDNGLFYQILVGYVNGATHGFDGEYYDAKKIITLNTIASFYSILETEEKLVIQGKAHSDLDLNETITLGFKTELNVPTIYKLSIADLEGEFIETNTLFLIDHNENKVHNLSNSDYNFTSTSGEFNDRFEVTFNANLLSNNDYVRDNNYNITIVNDSKNFFKFNTSISTISTIKIYDLLGTTVYKLNGSKGTEVYNLDVLKNSVYIAKIILADGNTFTKKFIATR